MKKKWLVLGLLASMPLIVWAANTQIKRGTYTVTRATSSQAGYSWKTDTVPLFHMYQNGWQGLWGRVIVHPSSVTTHSYGSEDSSRVFLAAMTGLGTYMLIDSVKQAAIGDTAYFARIANDTLWKEGVALILQLGDSVGDTVITGITHEIEWYFIPTE